MGLVSLGWEILIQTEYCWTPSESTEGILRYKRHMAANPVSELGNYIVTGESFSFWESFCANRVFV